MRETRRFADDLKVGSREVTLIAELEIVITYYMRLMLMRHDFKNWMNLM